MRREDRVQEEEDFGGGAPLRQGYIMSWGTSEFGGGIDGGDGGFKTNRPPPGDPCLAKLIKHPCTLIKPCLVLRTFKADLARTRRQGYAARASPTAWRLLTRCLAFVRLQCTNWSGLRLLGALLLSVEGSPGQSLLACDDVAIKPPFPPLMKDRALVSLFKNKVIACIAHLAWVE
jgi:hypothetical protein